MTVARQDSRHLLEQLLRKKPAPAAPPATPACGDEGHPASPPWAALQPELVTLIVRASAGADGQPTPQLALAVSQTCVAWRAAVDGDLALLRRVKFRALRLRPHAAPASSLPRLVERAAHAGNVAAALVAGRHLHSVQGRVRCATAATHAAYEAARHWCRAAKLGHPEAQLVYGLACYKGLMGLPRDSDQALLYLTRACKQLSDCLGLAPDGSRLAGPAAPADAGSPPAQLPLLLASEADCRRLLGQAAHVLAWLHWDGEATKQDTAAAVRHFKLATAMGDACAERFLGTLLKSGQFA